EDFEASTSFLLDRLADFERSGLCEADAREWHGHVLPAISRVQAALAHERARAASPAPQVLDDATEQLERAGMIIGQAYQIVGELASWAGLFGHPAVQRALDLLNYETLDGDGRAWPMRGLPPAPVASHEPASVSNKPGCVSSVGDKAESAAWREVLNQVLLVDQVAKRGKDGRAFIDARDWEYLLSMTRVALSAPPPEPAKAEVKVKALEWESVEHERSAEDPTPEVVGYEASTGFWCHYAIEITGGGAKLTYPEYSETEHETPDAAKSAAQADYERRILSALATPPTAPAAARSAAEEMRERCALEAEKRGAATTADAIRTLPLPGEEA
ncbi:hypothetical protein V5F37_24345, partial [Xanthobacter sp. V3C-2]